MNFKSKKLTTVMLGFLSFATILTTMYFNNASNKVTAITQESPFYTSGISENLFTVQDYGDLLVSVIRKDDGTSSGPIAYSLSKQKTLLDKSVLYNTDTEAAWSWELSSGVYPNATQVEQIQRALYAANYIFPYKLADYGLETTDELAVYEATQIAQWSILEGWTPTDVVKKPEVLADATMNAIADKIYTLYVDIYNYSVDTSKKTYQSGIAIQQAADGSSISNYTITQNDLNRPSYGSSYYRTPLMKVLPNQEYGYLFQGDYAFSYTVGFNGTVPEGTRVINKNGEPQTTFTTAPGQQLEFYVEIPADKVVGATGSVEVNVSTVQFRRAAPILWKPVTETAYMTLLENYYTADSASQSMTINYSGIGGVAQVIIDKRGEQVSGYQTVSTPYGDILKPVYSQLPLAGSKYEIYILSSDGAAIITATDGELYINGDKLFPGQLTSTSGQTSFDVLPMDEVKSETGYKVIETLTTGGYLAISALEQSLMLTLNPTGLASGTLTYNTNRVKVEFGFDKLEEYFDAGGAKAYRTVAGIVFGVYSTADLGTIPAGSLIGLLTSDASGHVDGNALDLPVNQQFTIKEISTKPNLSLDANTYTLDTTVAAGYSNTTVVIPVKDAAGASVTSITNYLRPGNFTITRNAEIFNSATGVFAYAPITSANGQIGIYSDASATTLVKTISNADFASGAYQSGNLPDGKYYIKDLGYNAQYTSDATIYSVDVVAGETKAVNLSNALKTTSITLTKLDATNPANKKAMANVTFKMTLGGQVVATASTNASGVIVYSDVKVGYTYEFVETVPTGYNIPTTNSNVNLTTADGSTSFTLTVENTKTVISSSVRISVKDEVTGLSVQGIEYAIYAKSDTGFTTPLGTMTTDAQGNGLISSLPAAEYVLKETKTLDKYFATANQNVDLTKVADSETLQINITAKVVKIVLSITEVDEWTNAALNGGKFGLYASSNLSTPIAEFVVADAGVFNISNVTSGTYVLKQTQAPSGYILNTSSQSVTVNTKSSTTTVLTFKNKPVSALVRVVSVDAGTNARLQGAKYDLFYNNDASLTDKLLTITTNTSGQADIANARIGIYKLVETVAPVGYKKQSVDVKIDLSTIQDGDIVTITVKYSKTGISENPTMQIERPVTGAFDNGFLFIILSGLMIILGLGIGALSLLKISDRND